MLGQGLSVLSLIPIGGGHGGTRALNSPAGEIRGDGDLSNDATVTTEAGSGGH